LEAARRCDRIWGVPRGTVDVDINVFVEDDGLDKVIDILVSLGLSIETSRAKVEARERGMFVGTWTA
jgi:hypothetical protein